MNVYALPWQRTAADLTAAHNLINHPVGRRIPGDADHATQQSSGAEPTDDSPVHLSQLFDDLLEDTSGDRVKLGELLNAVSRRSFGPLLLLIGIVSVSPIGAIPGMSTISGTIIILLSLQILIGRSRPTLPSRLLQISFERKRLEQTIDRARPWVKWSEKWIYPRFTFLAGRIGLSITAIFCMILALTFYPLALIPMGVFLPGMAVTLMSLGITTKDGLFQLVGYAMAAVALTTSIVIWPF